MSGPGEQQDPAAHVTSVAQAGPAQAGLVEHRAAAGAQRQAPVRHTALGCSILVIFMIVSGGLGLRQGIGLYEMFSSFGPGGQRLGVGTRAPAAQVQAGLSSRTVVALQQLRGSAQALSCLKGFSWDHPDQPCRERAIPAAMRWDGHIAAFGPVDGEKQPEVLAVLQQAVAMQSSVAMVPAIEAAPGPGPNGIDAAIMRTGIGAEGLVQLIDALVPPEPSGTAIDPLGTGLQVMTGTDPTGQIELDARPAAEPGDEREVAARPADQPVVEPTRPALELAPPAPVASVVAAPAELVEAVRAEIGVLEACPRTLTDVPECVARARTGVGRAESMLAAYRNAPREGEAKVSAAAFARLIDAAVGRTRRAVVAFSVAGQTLLARGPGSEGGLEGDPFPEADAALREAKTAIATAEAAVAGAAR